MAFRIGIEAQRIFREKKHGMDFVALEMIRALQAIDQVNEYVVFVKPDVDRCLEPTANFKIVEVPGSTYPYWEQVMLPGAARAEKIQLLHCTSNTAPIQSGIPFILTLHDIIYMESSPLSGGTAYQKFGNLYRRMVVPRVVRKAEKIITVSEYEREVIVNKFPEIADKTEVVYNGKSEYFHNNYSKEEVSETLKKYKLPDSFIFFLGNTDPKKNLKGVIEAYNDYVNQDDQPVPLVVADLSKDHLKNVLKSIGANGMENHIILPGYIPNKDLPLIYNAAELFLYPSLRESFGIPMIEAMACGTPVITSTTACMPEVSGGAAALVNPVDSKEISKKIKEILINKNLRSNLKNKGLERAQHFMWTTTAKKCFGKYEKILIN